MSLFAEKVHDQPQDEHLLPPTDYVTETFTPAVHSPEAYTPMDTVHSEDDLESAKQT
jgi:hypothetical protein